MVDSKENKKFDLGVRGLAIIIILTSPLKQKKGFAYTNRFVQGIKSSMNLNLQGNFFPFFVRFVTNNPGLVFVQILMCPINRRKIFRPLKI